MSNWQPMDTAPKTTMDGPNAWNATAILAILEDLDYDFPLRYQQAVIWWEPLFDGKRGARTSGHSYDVFPIFWMPLPEMPTEIQENNNE